MITNKRGISPLIATVLIVGFTIVLAVIVINFVLNTTESQTQSQGCQAAAEQACLSFAGPDKLGLSSVVTTGGPTDTVTVTNLAPEATNMTVTLLSSTGATKGSPYTTSMVQTGGSTQVVVISFGSTVRFATGDKIRVIPLISKTVDGYSCKATCTAASAETTVA